MAYEDKIINDLISNRLGRYPAIAEQLDALWHDIDDGKFGESAKSGKWYISIKEIKDEFALPKDGE